MEDVRQPAPPPPPQPPQPGGYQQPPQQGAPGMAIAGFVVSLIGLLISWIAVAGLVVSLVGLILAIFGRRQARERGAPSGLATAGLVIGIIAVISSVAWTVVEIAVVNDTSNNLNDITFTTTTQ
jgi:hypothetical protein